MKKSAIFSVLAAMLIFTGCGAQDNTTSGGDTGSNEAAGSSAPSVSGELTFYTSQPEEDVTKLVSAFNEKYPDVTVETFRSGTEEVTAKLQAENQAGEVQADLLLLADAVTFEGLKEQDLLLSYTSPEAESIPDELVDPDGAYTGTKVMATVIATNTDQVASAPTSWNTLTEEASKDAAIMPSPLYSGAAAYNIGVFSRTDGFGWEYLESLKNNHISVIKGNGAVLKSVASGEKSYGMVVDYLVAREKAKGSPIELSYPEEGVPIITEPIAIMKNTDNKEAAQAFVDFVLSEEGQELAAEIGYTPIREGIAPPEGLKSLSEFKVMSGDLATLTSEREADKEKFTEVFGN
ncbi:ABC transporter substrate-binding protein [Paenibacillus shunpengii]|uniref:ABC transporter substrate-binding protein n=1 Tax=Paenibacillus shunpengii TaxID=2054424 RepID=A0ABW5SUS1_9BACL